MSCRLDALLSRTIAPIGISLEQYRALRVIGDAGAVGIPTLTIADSLADRTPGITRLVDRLESRGLVRRERGVDRRQVICRITEKGVELLKSLETPVAEVGQAAFKSLTDNEVAALIHMLGRVQASMW